MWHSLRAVLVLGIAILVNSCLPQAVICGGQASKNIDVESRRRDDVFCRYQITVWEKK